MDRATSFAPRSFRQACHRSSIVLSAGMIGWINLSVEAFIRDSFGDDAWTATVAKVRPHAQLCGLVTSTLHAP